ncbi:MULTISPECIES: ABC transporter substrate-binding protein [unclassified Crossiella]|uniref:ABC transporter substrate-binding protein n=1 Tax=unclassified Crossiella TaxID=2620835 RepID=UPI001FFFFB3E|nr:MULTISPECIES: ABC transporter substrate-binding protein [unclassified Crossiella]MCK2239540.1 ABC transporter substrate-binding protein [Crossiella sp. S99.2]MCK2252235.1 ABC transporter substrate-binding protein [Crossiella sp. S99.1]
MTEPLRIGVALPRTGRLTPLGDPLHYVAQHFRALRLTAHGRPIEFRTADHQSTVDGARTAVCELARDGARLVVALGGTTVLPALAAATAELGLTFLSTALPWQVHRASCPPTAFHFCWGLDDIARTFADLWSRIPGADPVGLLWNNGPQGAALRDPGMGFLPAALRDRALVDPGGYPEPAAEHRVAISAFRVAGVRLVSSAATTADLARFSAAAGSLRLRLITCSRWLAYPFGLGDPALDRVATVVAWSPRHRCVSSVDGRAAAELAVAYQRDTGRSWLPPLGLAHALLEVATHALTTAADPADARSIAEALSHTDIGTITGRLDWTAGPVPTVAALPLAGGQWRHADGRPELRIVAAERVAAVTADGDLVEALRR